MQAAQDWFDNIQEAKIIAYMDLYETLLELGKPHIKGLYKADGTAVLASIADKSGQFISEVDKFTVYVSKKQETITKEPVAVSQEARKSILFQSTTKQHKTCASHKPFSCRKPEK